MFTFIEHDPATDATAFPLDRGTQAAHVNFDMPVVEICPPITKVRIGFCPSYLGFPRTNISCAVISYHVPHSDLCEQLTMFKPSPPIADRGMSYPTAKDQLPCTE
jgi:hypothetical protein